MNESIDRVYRTVTADRGDARRRLDRTIQRHLLTSEHPATRARVQRWIASGFVTVNGAPTLRPAARTMIGDVVTIRLPAGDTPAPRPAVAAEEATLDILYEDEHLLAVNKPAGLVVHPTYKHARGTLLNALLWHARDWTAPARPSLVGRLDRRTSGLLLVAKSARVHATLQRALASPAAEKDYLALVYGRLPTARGTIDLRLRRDPADRRRMVASPAIGAPSVTEFERLARLRASRVHLTLVRCRLRTGRTHQVRVHLAARDCPIVGDPVYGEARWRDVDDPALADLLRTCDRQALHAWRLVFPHPANGRRVAIEAPLPADMARLLGALGYSGT